MPRFRSILLVLFTLALAAPSAFAARVEFSVQPRSAYVGMPITLTITVYDEPDVETPELPEIDGFMQLGEATPSRRSFTQIINGRRSSSDQTTFTYRLVPQRTGTLTIPVMHFDVAGQMVQTEAVDIKVQEAQNDGLMSAEILAAVDTAYVGEPVELTLRISIKPYRDENYRITLSDQNMWSLLGISESQWGAFQPAIQDLIDRRRRPNAQTIRSSSDGEVRYQYDIKQVYYPERAGALDVGNIVLVTQYPIELRRDFFGSLGVERSRPVTATPTLPNLTVKPLPEQGKPAMFTGAVGKFSMNVDVKPDDVAVGEPITLSLTLTDTTRSGAQLELLKPPVLHEIDALTKDFRVHEEPLAGSVSGNRKTFTQTIRALNENVTQVPSIPFVFFDPRKDEYVTLHSEPIPIHVRPASTMAMSEIVQSSGVKPRATELTPVAGGILANFVGTDALLASESLKPSWWLIVLLALPPVLFVTVAIGKARAVKLGSDPALVRQRKALKRAHDALASAANATGEAGTANAVASAVAGYVADRCNLPPGAHTKSDVDACLKQRNINGELARETIALLQQCEHSAYTGSASRESNGLIREARDVIDKLHKASWS